MRLLSKMKARPLVDMAQTLILRMCKLCQQKMKIHQTNIAVMQPAPKIFYSPAFEKLNAKYN
jgi:hypothetical protein